jgi:site-specific recombinase XerD
MMLSEAIQIVYESRWKYTKDAYRSLNRAHNMLAHIGDIPLSEVNSDAVTKLVKGLEKKDSRTGTVNRYLAALKTIMNHHEQPIRHIKLRKESKGRLRVISREEEMRAVDLLRNSKHTKRRYFYPDVADLAEVLVDTGMRLAVRVNSKIDVVVDRLLKGLILSI